MAAQIIEGKKYIINPISFFSGIIVLYYVFKIVVEKVLEAIRGGKDILSINLSFPASQILTLLFFCEIFVLSVLIKDRKILGKSIPKFVSWIIHTSISVLLIYLLILFSISSSWFYWTAILVLFVLFVFKEMAKKEAT